MSSRKIVQTGEKTINPAKPFHFSHAPPHNAAKKNTFTIQTADEWVNDVVKM